MINSLKESYKLTNKYIILATPLILFSLLSSLYILFSVNGNVLGLLFAIVLFFLMLIAFLSGWFYMIKNAISDCESDEPNLLIKYFPSGVGEYFLPTCGLVLVSFLFSSLLYTAFYFLGMKFIGELGIPMESFSKALESQEALKLFLTSLTAEQMFRIKAWNLLLFISTILVYYSLMFYAPTLFYKTKNPLKAFFVALKDLFSRKFLKNSLLYFIIFSSYFVLSIFTTLVGHNIVLHFVFTLLNFYYLILVAVFVFNYYYQNFVKTGSIIDEIL